MSDGLGQAGSTAFAMRSGPCDSAVGAPKPQLCENAQKGPAAEWAGGVGAEGFPTGPASAVDSRVNGAACTESPFLPPLDSFTRLNHVAEPIPWLGNRHLVFRGATRC